MKKLLVLALGLIVSANIFAAQPEVKVEDAKAAASMEKVIATGTTLPGYVYTSTKEDLITLIKLAVANDLKSYEEVMKTLIANDAGGNLRENLKVEVLENDNGLVRLRLADHSVPIQVWTIQEAVK